MKYIWIGLGFLFLALGCVGVVLPILPTTPFLCLTAIFFAKGSKRMESWFKSTKIYKDNLESLMNKEGMTKGAKKRVMGCITGLFVIAAICMRDAKIGLIVMAIVWVIHAIVFACFVETKEEQEV